MVKCYLIFARDVTQVALSSVALYKLNLYSVGPKGVFSN